MDPDDVVADEVQIDLARRDIADNLAQYADGWSTTEGSVVTKWVCFMEVYSGDGEKYLLEVTSEDLTPWDRYGLIGYS